jgi:arylsulfatase A-like enzyme
LIVRWPGRVKPGTSDALVSQVDFAASFAALTGQKFEASTAPDSENQLPALLGDSSGGRESLVEYSGSLALREGTWKLIPVSKGPKRSQGTNIELGNDDGAQLYDLSKDPGEQTNLAAGQPARVTAMLKKLEEIKAKGSIARQGGP